MVEVPSAQERVTAKATPAEAMACTKADSRVAAGGDVVIMLRMEPRLHSLARGLGKSSKAYQSSREEPSALRLL